MKFPCGCLDVCHGHEISLSQEEMKEIKQLLQVAFPNIDLAKCLQCHRDEAQVKFCKLSHFLCSECLNRQD